MKTAGVYWFQFLVGGVALLVIGYFANVYRIESGIMTSSWLLAVSRVGFLLGFYLIFLGLIGISLRKKVSTLAGRRGSSITTAIVFMAPVLLVALVWLGGLM